MQYDVTQFCNIATITRLSKQHIVAHSFSLSFIHPGIHIWNPEQYEHPCYPCSLYGFATSGRSKGRRCPRGQCTTSDDLAVENHYLV